MSLAHCAAFGGILKIGGRDYCVRGRTYRKIAEQTSWWISHCFCPITELRILLHNYPAFSEKEFAARWVASSRQAMFSDGDLQERILSTFSARRFDIWQSCRDDGLTFHELDRHLDELTTEEMVSFFEEADKKMAIANGVGELDYLANCFTRVISPPSDDGSVEAMIAQVCVRNKNRILLSEILDSTPATIRTIFEDPEVIKGNLVVEKMNREKQSEKRAIAVFSNAALNIMEGKRADSWREPEKNKEPRRVRKIPSAKGRQSPPTKDVT